MQSAGKELAHFKVTIIFIFGAFATLSSLSQPTHFFVTILISISSSVPTCTRKDAHECRRFPSIIKGNKKFPNSINVHKFSIDKSSLFVQLCNIDWTMRLFSVTCRCICWWSLTRKDVKGDAILVQSSLFLRHHLDFLCLCIEALLQSWLKIEQSGRQVKLVIKMAKASLAWSRNHSWKRWKSLKEVKGLKQTTLHWLAVYSLPKVETSSKASKICSFEITTNQFNR